MIYFQEMILKLTQFWAEFGCLVHQGYDLEVGAGTFNPVTFLRCLGPEPYSAIYVEPSRRPQDGRYGENPNRLQSYHQMQVILKPSPYNIQDLYLQSLEAIGLDLSKHDIRFVHDDWENPTIGAWGLGWEVWADGMEISQFTYFQAVGGIPVKPVSGELTYGLERLALYLQGVDSFFDLMWNDRISYGSLYKRSEWEWSHYNFTEADASMWERHFNDFEKEAKRLVEKKLPIPAYDFVIKASHAFNMLDARGVISVTERTGYMGRIRYLAKLLAEHYLKSRKEQSFPLLKEKKENRPPVLPILLSKEGLDKKTDFLLEIGSEELPASFISIGLDYLKKQIAHLLQEKNLSFHSIKTYGTPRRLSLIIKDLEGGTRPKIVERKGPAAAAAFDEQGEPTQIGSGFFRSLKLENVSLEKIESGALSDLTIKKIKGQPYLFASIHIEAESTCEILAKMLPSLILKAEFPKKMRWSDLDIEYARPLQWLVALYGETVIPFAVAHLVSDRLSQGHRQLDPKPFSIRHAKEYVSTLREHFVMVDIDERKTSILEQIHKLEKEIQGKALAKERVLPEVTNLVEWPFVIAATFDEQFLRAPKEVLISEMVEHQKYFPVGTETETLLPYFLIVCNNKPTDLIRKGNQKALFPRLADGTFLYEQDVKMSFSNFNSQLKNMTFHTGLGNMWDKVERLKKITSLLHSYLPICEKEALDEATEFCKADLASLLVGEFPELQGYVGGIYARHWGKSEAVAQAIEEHWMPRGEKAPLPTSSEGILLSLADKIDNLLSCFSLNLKPSSSSDPYALRRQAMGLINILIKNELHFFLNDFLKQISSTLFNDMPQTALESFLLNRFRTILLEKEFDKDEIEATLSLGLTDPFEMYQNILKLHTFRKEHPGIFSENLAIYHRIYKILSQQELKEAVDPTLFVADCEEKLFACVKAIKNPPALPLLSKLKEPVATLFDQVQINDENPLIRKNRLALLQSVKNVFDEIVDFSKLQAK